MKDVSSFDPLACRQFPRAATSLYPEYFPVSSPVVWPLCSEAYGSDKSVINLIAHKYFWPLDTGRRGLEWTIGLTGEYWSIIFRTGLSEITGK